MNKMIPTVAIATIRCAVGQRFRTALAIAAAVGVFAALPAQARFSVEIEPMSVHESLIVEATGLFEDVPLRLSSFSDMPASRLLAGLHFAPPIELILPAFRIGPSPRMPAPTRGFDGAVPSGSSEDVVELTAAAVAPLGHARFCFAHPDHCARPNDGATPGRMALSEDRRAELIAVNSGVNRAIRPQPDAPGLINDIWTLEPAAGDCDDYAVTKRARLMVLGWPAHTLLLAQVVAPTGEDHLVLVARTSEGDLVLDNIAKDVLPASRTRLTWVAIQSPENPRQWRAAELRLPAERSVRVARMGRSVGR